MVQQFLSSQQLTGHVGAHVDDVLPNRMELEHLVEAGSAQYLGSRDARQLGYLGHSVRGDPPLLLLGQVE